MKKPNDHWFIVNCFTIFEFCSFIVDVVLESVNSLYTVLVCPVILKVYIYLDSTYSKDAKYMSKRNRLKLNIWRHVGPNFFCRTALKINSIIQNNSHVN